MEQKTLQAVRQAELAAEEIERDAAAQRDALLARARADAEGMVAEAVAEARAKAARELEAARGRGDALQAGAVEAVKDEIASLRTSASAKQEEARRLILAELA